jgi:hypothetical protein
LGAGDYTPEPEVCQGQIENEKLRIENEGHIFSILNFQLTETPLSGMLPVVLFTIGGGGVGVACA